MMFNVLVTQEREFSWQAQLKVNFRMLETRFKEKKVKKKKFLIWERGVKLCLKYMA